MSSLPRRALLLGVMQLTVQRLSRRQISMSLNRDRGMNVCLSTCHLSLINLLFYHIEQKHKWSDENLNTYKITPSKKTLIVFSNSIIQNRAIQAQLSIQHPQMKCNEEVPCPQRSERRAQTQFSDPQCQYLRSYGIELNSMK